MILISAVNNVKFESKSGSFWKEWFAVSEKYVNAVNLNALVELRSLYTVDLGSFGHDFGNF